jgi:DNA-binding transcriptional ArsR family regulator
MSDRNESGPRLPGGVIEAIADLMAALADPTRIALLESLRSGEASVQELADDLDLPHQNASHHVGILRRAGLVKRRREGRLAIYAIEDWTALWLIEQAARALIDPEA